ncbi:hypothetical protein TNCV_5001761 [Trichonephila clavipes]|nr:hypothetical protein TNCV_5001761 [Trichonephila clavipes]
MYRKSMTNNESKVIHQEWQPAPLRDDVTPPDKRFTPDDTPSITMLRRHTAKKARLLASHNELSRLHINHL